MIFDLRGHAWCWDCWRRHPSTQWLVHCTLHLIASLYMHKTVLRVHRTLASERTTFGTHFKWSGRERSMYVSRTYTMYKNMTWLHPQWLGRKSPVTSIIKAWRCVSLRRSQNMRDYSGHLSLLLLMHDCYYYNPGLSAHPRIVAWYVFLFLCSTDQSQFLMRDFCFDFWFRPFTCDIILIRFLLQLQKEVFRSTPYRDENGVQGCKTDEQRAYSVLHRQIDPYSNRPRLSFPIHLTCPTYHAT